MLSFYYLFVEKPFEIKGKALVYQVGENLFVVEPLEKGVEVVEKNKNVYEFDGSTWKEKMVF